MKTHILLLPDVFEKFMDISLEYYGFDPSHYFSSPGLSWNAKLSMTKKELELIDMYLFVKNGMRWDISCIAKRYGKANNKCIKSYDDRKPS